MERESELNNETAQISSSFVWLLVNPNAKGMSPNPLYNENFPSSWWTADSVTTILLGQPPTRQGFLKGRVHRRTSTVGRLWAFHSWVSVTFDSSQGFYVPP